MKRDPSLIRLSRDHHRGLAMALRIERQLSAVDEASISKLYDDFLAFWESGLLPHFRAECECLLARLCRHLGLEDALIARTQRDHLRIGELVTRMRDGADNAVRRDGLSQLASLLREHIRWEEEVLFQAVQKELSSQELAALRADIEARISEMPASTWEGSP
ncbi:MAG TPA: hemerythrin domain-containing protein [Dehalococcoidia bacterium]|nr:hemerythrin domain-containing protein [Dehalococcoidia bacterium]